MDGGGGGVLASSPRSLFGAWARCALGRAISSPFFPWLAARPPPRLQPGPGRAETPLAADPTPYVSTQPATLHRGSRTERDPGNVFLEKIFMICGPNLGPGGWLGGCGGGGEGVGRSYVDSPPFSSGDHPATSTPTPHPHPTSLTLPPGPPPRPKRPKMVHKHAKSIFRHQILRF